MSRREVLSVAVRAVEERRLRIEAEALPPNIGALLDAAADEVPNPGRAPRAGPAT